MGNGYRIEQTNYGVLVFGSITVTEFVALC